MKRVLLAAAAIAMIPAAGATAASVGAVQTPNPAAHADSGVIQVAEVKKNGSLADEKAAVKETFEEWAEKVGDTAEGAGNDAGDAASKAWANVKSAWGEVKDASEETWDDAKAGFDDAIDRLEKAFEE